jgi:drug/metabolite transporter (DMT)-like permease
VSTEVFLAVIAAALLHAVWNALVKHGADKHVAMTAIVLGHLPVALPVLAFVPFPARESWPWLGFGVLLHVSYQLFLLAAYRFGDLGQVYPLARGSAPLFIAIVSVGLLGVALAPLELLGIGVIVMGMLLLGFVRLGDGDGRAAAYALGTGAFIAAYSLVDGAGARLSGSPVGYFAVNCLSNAAIFTTLVSWLRPGTLAQVPVAGWRPLVIGGPASFVAYSLVVWAFTVAPIALVAALRETSIVFAMAIGALFLGERPGRVRILAAGLTLVGAVLLRLSA